MDRLRLTAIGALSLLQLGCSSLSKPDLRADQERRALQAAVSIRESLSRGDCSAIYEQTDAFFQSEEPREGWLTACENLKGVGSWSNVASQRALGQPRSSVFAVLESLPAPVAHSRTLLTVWQFEGNLAKLHGFAFAEDNVAVVQVPKSPVVLLAGSLNSVPRLFYEAPARRIP